MAPRSTPVPEVVGREEGSGLGEDGAELDRPQRDFPELHDIAKHDEHAIATTDADSAQELLQQGYAETSAG